MHDGPDAIDTPLGVDEGAVLFKKRCAGQKDVGKASCFVQEQVLDDDTFHRRQCCLDVLGVGIRLSDIFTLNVDPLEFTGTGFVQHVRDAEARFIVQVNAPVAVEDLTDRRITNGTVTRQFVWEGAHVARALDIILAPHRVDADPGAADVASGHREVRHGHDHGRALAVFCDAKAIVDGAIARSCVKPRGCPDRVRIYSRDCRDFLGRILRCSGEGEPVIEGICLAALSDEVIVEQALVDNDMCEGVHHGHIRAG